MEGQMASKMLIRLVVALCACLCYTRAEQRGSKTSPTDPHCITGYMTDRQSWVTADGMLNTRFVDPDSSVDLSYMLNPIPHFQRKITSMRTFSRSVLYLSLAKCELTRVPLIFQMVDHKGRDLSETIKYMSFYGNMFRSLSVPGKEYDVTFNATNAAEVPIRYNVMSDDPTTVWSASFERAEFPRLKELDLRKCSIQALGTGVFRKMANLEALYIGENNIIQITQDSFIGLTNLYHLDFSRNNPVDNHGNLLSIVTESLNTFANLSNIVSIDLSHTNLSPRNFNMIRGLGKTVKSLSLCNTSLTKLEKGIFAETSIEILDVSRNNGILGKGVGLEGLEKSLVVLSAEGVGIKSMNIFKNFAKLEILQLPNNHITNMSYIVARSLKNLQVLDLHKNRIISWFNYMFTYIPNLRLLSLAENNINVISDEMIKDLIGIDYIALSGNLLVCNCHANDFYRMAAMNEFKYDDEPLKSYKKHLYNTGYLFYNEMITNRSPVHCDGDDCEIAEDLEETGRFRILDNWTGSYKCLRVPENKSVPVSNVSSCNKISRETTIDDDLIASRKKLYLIFLVIPCLMVPMIFIYTFRRNLKYFCITMRNSAMMGLINRDEAIDDGTIFNYDVFVSYCNEDRGWVLDHLLPHIEADCSISACLHERDFQVGLSILENIVSCMDRSRSIMLIISQQFLLSQWCQFEMHLAQHRLLETRREDLILVLLEDIPRRARPNTLHYLMLTKTYIVWPKDDSERAVFWRRMKKSLMSQKTKHNENVSLA